MMGRERANIKALLAQHWWWDKVTCVAGFSTWGMGVMGSRPAGHSWLWSGPVDPILFVDGLILASEGSRLRQRWGKMKICCRKRRWERGLMESILQEAF